MRFVKPTTISLLFGLLLGWQPTTAEAQWLPLKGFGSGVYHPNATLSGGEYHGPGISTVLGFTVYRGTVEITGADPTGLHLTWQNRGYGTDAEELHVNRTFFGSLGMRVQGTTDLIPLDAAGNFTAIWKGRFEIVKGTGLFRRARGYADVTAQNFPFQLTDPDWPFLWKWSGKIRLW